MKICIVGKYPPIEGGVSSSTYWLARGLAQRGHEVFVVTNASEVEADYRMALEASDINWYQPSFPETGGFVKVVTTAPFDAQALNHIPLSNPLVTKIAAAATDVVRHGQCEVILAYYYEPYAIGASLASQWTKCPLIVKHAGSDLDRLFRSQSLATAYREMLRNANAVVTRPALMERFLGMGVSLDQLEADVPFSVPSEVFQPRQVGANDARGPVVFGIYGKIGETKGTYDLLAALDQLARKRMDVRLRALVGSVQGRRLLDRVSGSALEGRVDVLPFVPNWRVPEFIHSCTAIAFLERDFPVAIHGPIVPREVLACGTCLVLSKEILLKQTYQSSLVSGENVVVVEDPKDSAALVRVLEKLVARPTAAIEIGARGGVLSRSLEDFDGFISGWELLFRRAKRETSSKVVSGYRPTGLDLIAPGLVSLARELLPGVVENFRSAEADQPLQSGIRFCDAVADMLLSGTQFAEARGAMLELLRFQKARLETICEPMSGHDAPFAVMDRLQRRRVNVESASALYPVRGNGLRLDEFEYDVLPQMVGQISETASFDLAAIAKRRILVLFQRSPNWIARELSIDDATRQLLDLCDGTRSCEQLIAHFCGRIGLESSEQAEYVTEVVLRALERLYQADVIVFGEYAQGWGWTGGMLSDAPRQYKRTLVGTRTYSC